MYLYFALMHILNLLIYEATFLLTFNTDLFTIIRYNKKFTNSTIIKLISVQNESLYYVPNTFGFLAWKSIYRLKVK